MPVTTTVYLHDRADYRIVFAKCVELIGAPARMRTSDDGGMVSTSPDQDPCACTSGTSPAWASGLTRRQSGGHGATTATASFTAGTTASPGSPSWTSDRRCD
jgi:type IV secretory pathway TrbL component